MALCQRLPDPSRDETGPVSRHAVVALALALALALIGPTRARTSWFDEAAYASRGVSWMDSARTDSAYLDARQADARLFVVYPSA